MSGQSEFWLAKCLLISTSELIMQQKHRHLWQLFYQATYQRPRSVRYTLSKFCQVLVSGTYLRSSGTYLHVYFLSGTSIAILNRFCDSTSVNNNRQLSTTQTQASKYQCNMCLTSLKNPCVLCKMWFSSIRSSRFFLSVSVFALISFTSPSSTSNLDSRSIMSAERGEKGLEYQFEIHSLFSIACS